MKKLIEKLKKAVKKLRDKIKSALQPNMKPVALSYQVGGGMVNKWHLIAPTWVDELAAARRCCFRTDHHGTRMGARLV